jgi:hypothetical protein
MVEISVTGGIPKKLKKSSRSITHSMSSELVQNGTIKFDQNTGWITNQNINVKTHRLKPFQTENNLSL